MSDENVFEGSPDARQLSGPEIPEDCRLFRKRYRALTLEEIALHDAIKDKADELAALIAQVKPFHVVPPAPASANGVIAKPAAILHNVAHNQGANVTIALRHLEDCVYRAVKALTA